MARTWPYFRDATLVGREVVVVVVVVVLALEVIFGTGSRCGAGLAELVGPEEPGMVSISLSVYPGGRRDGSGLRPLRDAR